MKYNKREYEVIVDGVVVDGTASLLITLLLACPLLLDVAWWVVLLSASSLSGGLVWVQGLMCLMQGPDGHMVEGGFLFTCRFLYPSRSGYYNPRDSPRTNCVLPFDYALLLLKLLFYEKLFMRRNQYCNHTGLFRWPFLVLLSLFTAY